MNNIKKGLIILSLASVCVAGFAATKPVPQQQTAAQKAERQSAPEPTQRMQVPHK